VTRCKGGDAPSRTQGRGQGQAWRVHQSVDATLGARAQALPELVLSANQGTMNNVALGGRDPLRGRPFAYYGTVSGGPEVAPTGPASRPSTPTSQHHEHAGEGLTHGAAPGRPGAPDRAWLWP